MPAVASAGGRAAISGSGSTTSASGRCQVPTGAARRIPRWAPWARGSGRSRARRRLRRGAPAGKAGRGPRCPGPPSPSCPFRNLSEDTSYAYVARGLHDELLTQLVKVASLRVVGRASVGGYAETSKPLRQIGEELAVGSIVEAGVQVDGNRLRVTVQFLDPTHPGAPLGRAVRPDAWTTRSPCRATSRNGSSPRSGRGSRPPRRSHRGAADAGRRGLRVLPAGARLPAAAGLSPREFPHRPAALRAGPGARLRLRAGPRRPGFSPRVDAQAALRSLSQPTGPRAARGRPGAQARARPAAGAPRGGGSALSPRRQVPRGLGPESSSGCGVRRTIPSCGPGWVWCS